MNEHPDFINVRQLSIVLAGGPLLLLALLTAIDLSWHQLKGRQSAEVQCPQAIPASTAKLDANPCK